MTASIRTASGQRRLVRLARKHARVHAERVVMDAENALSALMSAPESTWQPVPDPRLTQAEEDAAIAAHRTATMRAQVRVAVAFALLLLAVEPTTALWQAAYRANVSIMRELDGSAHSHEEVARVREEIYAEMEAAAERVAR